MKRIAHVVLTFILFCFESIHASIFSFMGRAGLIALASPNTLTNLIPTLYAAADIVSREQVGFIPAVTRDSKIDRVALNQTVNVPVVGAITPVSITPGAYAPDSGGATPGNVTVTISNQYAAPIAWNGDEQVATSQTGIYDNIVTQRFAQAMRAITNLVETDLAALHVKASRAYGAGVTTQPFGTAADLSDMAQVIKILEDNGAPSTDMRAVLSSSAIANIRGKQSALFKVNEAGTDLMLRRGIIGDIFGVGLGQSAQVKQAVTAGTMANATTNAAGYAVGATVITLATAGTGVAIAGDIVTVTGDATNHYVIKSVVFAGANPAAGDTITLQEPGLRQAIPAGATALTLLAATDRNMVFSKSAIVLATRSPYMPEGGDDADDMMDIVDPVSGLSFQVAMYRQYRQVHFEVGLAWGVQMIAPRHTAILYG